MQIFTTVVYMYWLSFCSRRGWSVHAYVGTDFLPLPVDLHTSTCMQPTSLRVAINFLLSTRHVRVESGILLLIDL
jgi:hypothetical protein